MAERKPVQVVLTPKEYEMVRDIANSRGISVRYAIRRAIYLQEWMTRLQQEPGVDNLFLSTRDNQGQIETNIPIKALPFT